MISTGDSQPGAEDLGAVARELLFRLEVNRDLGWRMPLGRHPLPPAPSPDVPEAVRGAPRVDVDSERARRQALLDEVEREVRICRGCALCEARTQTVFGVGDPLTRLLFIGEGPGFDEDRLGEPFVGKAGKLLDRMIVAMGLERSSVYIANIVKCRPPQNRRPEPAEALACMPYLRRQIEIIGPEVICALGSTPTRHLLGMGLSVTRARGRFHEFEGIQVMPTFHPAYLLRNPTDKRLVWEDLQQIMALLGLSGGEG